MNAITERLRRHLLPEKPGKIKLGGAGNEFVSVDVGAGGVTSAGPVSATTGTFSGALAAAGITGTNITLTGSTPQISAAGAGTKVGATVSVVEYGNGVIHQTVFTFAATPLAVTDALAYAGTQIYDFPEGRIYVLGATSSIQWAVTSDRTTTINDNASLTWAVGTATASNATLSASMVDLIPKTTKVLAAAAAALNTASTAVLAAAAFFDGTSTAKDAFLNGAFETATDIDADGTLTATGTLTLTWINLGDF